MDVWFTLKVGKRADPENGKVAEVSFAHRECFLVRVAPRLRETIEKAEGKELHRLLDVAIEELNGTIAAANSVLF